MMISNACKPVLPTASTMDMDGGQHLGRPIHQSSGYLNNDEPSLDEMLADEVVKRVMARDGVAADHIIGLLDRVRAGFQLKA